MKSDTINKFSKPKYAPGESVGMIDGDAMSYYDRLCYYKEENGHLICTPLNQINYESLLLMEE